MDLGGAAGAAAGSSIDITTIPLTTHLFFDDEPKHVTNVNQRVQEYNDEHTKSPIQLTSILCPTGDNVVLVKRDGSLTRVGNIREYSGSKLSYFNPPEGERRSSTHRFFTDNFHDLKDSGTTPFGSGFTSDVIDQIIEFERLNPGNQRLYFFDFDNLLSLPGVFTEPTDDIASDDYAHFLFSDYVKKSDYPRDRINLLKQMFRLIGERRSYIITCNPAASTGKKNTKRRSTFIAILRVLLPTLIDDHVKFCNRRISDTKIEQDKGHHIVEFIKASSPSSGGSIKRRRMTSKKIKRTRHGRRSRKYTHNLRRNKYRK